MIQNDTKDQKPEETVETDTSETTPTPPAEQKSILEPDYKELFMRANADLQNFQRRIDRERSEWAVVIQANVLEKIVPFIDELERAISAAEQNIAQEQLSWLEGFQLMLKNFKKTLTTLGVEEIDTTGVFNPVVHEALMQVESQDHSSGHIVQILSRGYIFKGKVIRHARVSVAK